MLVGESKVFTAAGIFGGYEYSWSHFRPDSNEDLYSKVESLSPDQVKFTALKETRECHFIGGCIETPVYLVVYLLDHKGLHSGGQTNTAAIHIGCSGRYFPRS